MTPGARIQAAIEILDQILKGDAAEKALSNWARSSRYAGSKDRAAVRDHVFSAIRRKRSSAAIGGGMTGRAIMMGKLRQQDIDPAELFDGVGHAPAPLSVEEQAMHRPESKAEALDLPDWILTELDASLGDQAEQVAQALRSRAPVFVRVNLSRGTVDDAIATLQEDMIKAVPHPLAPSALEIVENPRRLNSSRAYETGVVELQDVASQAVVTSIPIRKDMKILDFCAGGGGKALALADLSRGPVEVHDIDVNRMKDIPLRAARAGADITLLPSGGPFRAPYDLVLCDVPCSGSGAWRRAPEGKWSLTPDRLAQLCDIQQDILAKAAALVGKGGMLAYATCSVFQQENSATVARFLQRHPDWSCSFERQFLPADGGDGFYTAHLTQD